MTPEEIHLIEVQTTVRAAFLVARRGFHTEARSIIEEAGYRHLELYQMVQLGVDKSELDEIFRSNYSSAVKNANDEAKKDKTKTSRYFYYLSVRIPPGFRSHDDSWDRIWYDYIEAVDRKTAIKTLESELDAVIKQKIIAAKPKLVEDGIIEPSKKATKADFKIFISEPDEYWDDHWQRVRKCKQCGINYSFLKAKQFGMSCNGEYCSTQCNNAKKPIVEFGDYSRGWGSGKPCIYKITNKHTGMVYIGQTTQVYTLRWYQHAFQPTKSKFHKAMQESKPEDWLYEVLEVFNFSSEEKTKAKLREREHFWIKHFDSIQKGYNSATVIKEEDEEKDDSQFEFDFDKGDK